MPLYISLLSKQSCLAIILFHTKVLQSVKQTSTWHQACFYNFFQNCFETQTFLSAKYSIFHSRTEDWGVNTATRVGMSASVKGGITKGLCIDHVWLSFWGVSSSYCLWSVSCHCEVLRACLKLRHLISVQYYYFMRYAYISFEFALTAVALDIVIVVYMKGRVGLRGGGGGGMGVC